MHRTLTVEISRPEAVEELDKILLPETDRRAPYPLSWEEQTRLFQDLLGHKSGRITTRYSQAELANLIEAAKCLWVRHSTVARDTLHCELVRRKLFVTEKAVD